MYAPTSNTMVLFSPHFGILKSLTGMVILESSCNTFSTFETVNIVQKKKSTCGRNLVTMYYVHLLLDGTRQVVELCNCGVNWRYSGFVDDQIGVKQEHVQAHLSVRGNHFLLTESS